MFRYFFTYDADIPAGLAVKNFSPTHLAWLAVTLAAIAAACVWQRRRPKEKQRGFLRACVWAIIGLEAAREAWALAIGVYDLRRHLPLHLCGVMIFIEAIAVFSDRPFFKEFSYACGLPGAFMALATPEPSGYPLLSFQYLQSIVIHALLVLVPLLMVIGGFRPNIRALGKNLLLLIGLAAFCFALNLALGGTANYMFVHFAPADTPIALFEAWVGWPWYILPLLGFVFLLWLPLYLPWAIADRRRKRRLAEEIDG